MVRFLPCTIHKSGGGCLFSVALSVLPPLWKAILLITEHPALWSSDFPPAPRYSAQAIISQFHRVSKNKSQRSFASLRMRHRNTLKNSPTPQSQLKTSAT